MIAGRISPWVTPVKAIFYLALFGGLAVAAKDTTQGANETEKASRELSQMAARLQTVVAKFTF